MKTILLHSLTGTNNQIFDPNERDGYNDPLIYLREKLLELGYDLKTADNHSLKNCEWVFFYEGNSVKPYAGWKGIIRWIFARLRRQPVTRNLYAECIQAGMQDKIALFLWEAPAVIPGNWSPKLHRLFPLIFTWHDQYAGKNNFVKIHWPQTQKFPMVPDVPFSQRKLLINISMNKSSRHPRELYSARRTSIRYFEQNQPDQFDLFGVGWNCPTSRLERIFPGLCQMFPCYRGAVKNKWDVLPRYRFSLCYENIRDEPGWITEKIFDCMRAKCIPIYWGASNITDYVDPDAFIDRRKFQSDAHLETFLLNMTESEFRNYQAAIIRYLSSDRFAKFMPAAYADSIVRALKL
jgi:hypothetical protein